MKWENSGMAAHGEYLTLNSPEYPTSEVRDSSGRWHSGAGASFLSDILETTLPVPSKYSLSAKACEGIIRRAEKREKPLPPQLEEALRERAQGSSSTRGAEREG